MPYLTEWVEPDVFLTHNGVTVYCTYKDDDMQNGPRSSCFSLNDLCGEQECACVGGNCKYVFDVRELANWTDLPHPPFLSGDNNTLENKKAWEKCHDDRVEEKHVQTVIREALDRGLLTPPPPVGPGQGPTPPAAEHA
jgi:hypothetical protein